MVPVRGFASGAGSKRLIASTVLPLLGGAILRHPSRLVRSVMSAMASIRATASIKSSIRSSSHGCSANAQQRRNLARCCARVRGRCSEASMESQCHASTRPSRRRTVTYCGTSAFGSGFVSASTRIRAAGSCCVDRVTPRREMRQVKRAELQHLCNDETCAEARVVRQGIRQVGPRNQLCGQRRHSGDDLGNVVGCEAMAVAQDHDAFNGAGGGAARREWFYVPGPQRARLGQVVRSPHPACSHPP